MNSEAILPAADMANAPPATTSRTPLYATPPTLTAPLRVVLVAPQQVPAWLLRFFDLASDNRWLDLVVLPIDGERAPSTSALPADLRALLAYERRRVISRRLEPVALGSHADIALETAIPGDLDVARLRAGVSALRPDLVLLLGAPQWAEALGDRAQWGCWHLDRSLTDAGRAVQALLGPVMRGEFATPLELQLHHLDRPPTTLVASWGSTRRASASAQCEQAFLKVPALLMRSLRQLANGGLHVPQQRTARLQLVSTDTPTGFGAGVRTFASTLAFRLAAKRRQRSQPNDAAWRVLLRHGAAPIDPDAPDVRQHSVLSAPGNQFWADPCAVEDAGRRFLFVEQWTQSDPKGVIACLELLPDARVRPLGVALDRSFHLSYPQPFQWEGQWYLTAESGQDSCVSLYRADAFPLRWQHVAQLVSGRTCVDPTLHYHDHHWYLFANVAESGGSTWDELFLFVADSLTGPFRPHPANPIVSDARRARPAGHLFQRDGRLVRPAQDCAPSYGAAVVFNEVLELSPTHYRERALGRLDARWASGLDGCHTYNETGGVEVLDVRGTPPADSARLTVLEVSPVDEAPATGRSVDYLAVPGLLKP